MWIFVITNTAQYVSVCEWCDVQLGNIKLEAHVGLTCSVHKQGSENYITKGWKTKRNTS